MREGKRIKSKGERGKTKDERESRKDKDDERERLKRIKGETEENRRCEVERAGERDYRRNGRERDLEL